LSLVDLTEADWALFDEQVFKMGSAQDSSPGQFKVKREGCSSSVAVVPVLVAVGKGL
jgi:hypothetical protein